YVGFKDVIGSWKIIDISLPRILRISASDLSRRFSPFNLISPPTILPGLSTSWRMHSDVILLPDPDSQTSPTVFPFGIYKVTPSTALTSKSSVKKDVFKSFISKMLSVECDSVTIYFTPFQ